jgi:hypothetical protein
MLESMGTLDTKEQWDKLLKIIPDEQIRKELDQDFTNNQRTPIQKWDRLASLLQNSKVFIF